MNTIDFIDSLCFGEVHQSLEYGKTHAKRGFSQKGLKKHWRLNVENSDHLHFDQGHEEFKSLGKSIVLEWPSPTRKRVFNY